MIPCDKSTDEEKVQTLGGGKDAGPVKEEEMHEQGLVMKEGNEGSS